MGLCGRQSNYGADDSQYCVSCASIVAKVIRDHLMDGFDMTFPGYAFSKTRDTGQLTTWKPFRSWDPAKSIEGVLAHANNK